MIVKAIFKYSVVFVLTVILIIYPEKVAAGFSLAITTLWDIAVTIGRSIHFPGKKEAAAAFLFLPGGIIRKNAFQSNTSEQREN